MTESEKLLRHKLNIEYDMLQGNINRMYTCDSVSELLVMYRCASIRLARICELRQGQLKEKKPAPAGTGTDETK